MARAAPLPPTASETCDLDFVRAQAELSFPDYRIDVARGEQGVVTLRFTPRNGQGPLAIALRAAGTRLSTSVTAIGVDDAELARVSEPVAMWWQQTELQRTLAACCAVVPESAEVDLGAAARAALEPGITHGGRGPLRAALVLGGAWIALAALLCVALLRSAPSPAERGALLALFAFSFLLNWLLCARGPGDLRLNLAAVWWTYELEVRWGPAPVAFFRLLALIVGGIHDVQIQLANLVLSSLLPILVYAIVAELGVGKLASLLAAFVTAAHPLLIAFSGDLGRQPTYLFAALGSIVGLLGFLKRGGAAAITALILGTILAVGSRPEGAHVLIVDGAILLLVPSTLRRRGAVGIVLAILTLLAFVYVRHILEYGGQLAEDTHPLWADPATLLWTVVLNGDFTPLAWIIVWTVGLVLGVRRRAAWVAIVILVGLHIAWSATGLYASFVGYDRQVASARYESILLLPFAIGTALFVDAVVALPTWVMLTIAGVVTAFTLITYPRAYDTLLRPFTVDYEYGFLRRHILALPSESHVYVLQAPANDVGFVDADLIGLFVRNDVRFDVWNPLQRDGLPSGPDTYLYIGSSCAALADQRSRPLGADFPRWLRDCTSIRTELAGNAIEEIAVPAHKMSWHEFTQPTVRLGLYRLPHSSGAH